MGKQELESLNDLFFRWWKEEIRTGEKLNKKLDELMKQNRKLKAKNYENSL